MSGTSPVYLDWATSAPLDEEVINAMTAVLRHVGGPDALHPAGATAAVMLERARARVAGLVGANPDEIIFTAGATEARNLAAKGLLAGNRGLGARAVATTIEHPAVMSVLRSHLRDGGDVGFVAVDGVGKVAPSVLAAAVDDQTAVVCIHHAQHEIGTIQNLETLIAGVRAVRPDVRVVVDAGESLGVLEMDVATLGADGVVIGGPTLGAPAWAGALWLRAGARLYPLIEGGSQESGKRAGAVDLAGAIALGVAAERITDIRTVRASSMRSATASLAGRILAIPGTRLNGPPVADRLPGHLQVSVSGITGESLALGLATRGVYVAPGSTCTADAGKASPTLEAIGCGPEWTHAAILMTLGPTTTDDDIERAASAFRDVVAQLRAMSPLGR